MPAVFEEHPEQEPLVTNPSPKISKVATEVPEDLVARMKEIHNHYGKEWLRRPDRKPVNADWELQLHMREIQALYGITHEELQTKSVQSI